MLSENAIHRVLFFPKGPVYFRDPGQPFFWFPSEEEDGSVEARGANRGCVGESITTYASTENITKDAGGENNTERGWWEEMFLEDGINMDGEDGEEAAGETDHHGAGGGEALF
ncbi:hypothetical protein NDU88_002746 [Pleurodeles waltl]|uniref:Uncharacterized protein n=1 Tax=Pleurodeles waltl TaxID=8319 RepID=A0AAV7TMT5_PLEWA|nr:hypothetical protein NDU88_002746 [Pleurodeles waltl]